jgi:hypothetical protein
MKRIVKKSADPSYLENIKKQIQQRRYLDPQPVFQLQSSQMTQLEGEKSSNKR